MDAQAALAYASVIRRDASTAAEKYALLKPHANTVTQTGTACIGRLLGLLAGTMRRFDEAQTHFEDTLEFCRNAGYGPELAWTCYDYAALLLDRNSPGDGDKAISLLREAQSISSKLGMKPLMERATALVDSL